MLQLIIFIEITFIFSIVKMRSLLFHPCSSFLFCYLTAISRVFAQENNTVFSQSTTCDAQCQQLALMGSTWESSQHAHTPRDTFYTVPDTFSPSSEPGTLLRVEMHTDLVNYTVPSGLTMSRIMFTSKDLNGTIVPVSAYVLWPYSAFELSRNENAYDEARSNSTEFPLVGWTHGTSGLFPPCAPSNYRALQYHFMVPFQLALSGFAVVAPDYAGLGVGQLPNGDRVAHQYNAAPAQANDLAYAIQAARLAFSEQLKKNGPFVAIGHSQGGAAAWAFAERQAVEPVPGYRGTVTISPPTSILDQIRAALQTAAATSDPSQVPSWASLSISLQPDIIAAVTAVYPLYNFSGMTPFSFDRWNNVLAVLEGCFPTKSLVFDDVPADQLAKPEWFENDTVQEWVNRTAVSGKKFKGPLLVIDGDRDVFPAGMLEKAVKETCMVAAEESLEMVTYQAMEHFPVIQASRMKWMDWIKEHIVNENSERKPICGSMSTVKGFNTEFTVEGRTFPNWLVETAGAQESWKFSL